MLRLLYTIDSICRRHGIYRGISKAERQTLLTSLCGVFVDTVIHQCGLRDNPRSSSLIVEATEYVHAHFREKISVPDMAHSLLCHQQTLSDQFRDAFGMTITAYVNRLRAIDVHARLAKNASLTLAEAAEAAGFGSVRSMLRAYKREFGCTPTENR